MSENKENQEDKNNKISEFDKLVVDIHNNLVTRLDDLMSKLLNSAEDKLFNMSDEADSNEEQARYFELMNQVRTLKPEIAILDETDSGLDIDALRIVSEGVNALTGSDMGVLVITHYQRLLNYIKPNFVHVMYDGRIVESGGPELALQLEEQGYEWIREKYGAVTA